MLSIVPGALITLNKGINEEDNEIYSPNLHFFSNKFYAKKKKGKLCCFHSSKTNLLRFIMYLSNFFSINLQYIHFGGFLSFTVLKKIGLHYT